MDFISSARTFFANIDIFIADMISKVYLLILQLADVNLVNDVITDIIERVYAIIGLFMLFKMALVIINYIINPDKQQAVSKFVTRVIVALILIPTVPAIFEKAYELQKIILTENVIGNIILGDGAGKNSGELEKIGDEVSYLVFSNFLDYNDEGALKLVFEDCPNIFIESDTDTNEKPVKYCCISETECPSIPLCGYYLYYPRFGQPNSDGEYEDSRDDYYACKTWPQDMITTQFQAATMKCGIRDGQYIYDLINKGRAERSVATILSKEIITAIETDPIFFYLGSGGAKGVSATCNPTNESYSDGDFVFSYHFIQATLVSLIITFLLIVICVDIGIRTIKLAFLQVISPIPIISYIDIKDSKLFKGWLKETITTYLQLFIRLAIVYFSVLLFRWLLNSVNQYDAIVNIFIIVGILLFMLQMPKLLCDLFNLNKENGFFGLIKSVGKFAVGATAIGVSSIGGTAANIAATPDNIKNVKSKFSNASNSLSNFRTNMSSANGVLGKLGVFGSTIKSVGGVPISLLKVPGSIAAGGVSSGFKMASKLVKNKGSYKSGDIASSIHESSMERNARSSGISGLSQEDIKSEITALENRQANLQDSYKQSQDYISSNLAIEDNSDDIIKAFENDYDSYADYVADMTARGESSHIIDEDKYKEYDKLYAKQKDYENELDEIEERLELLNSYVKKT